MGVDAETARFFDARLLVFLIVLAAIGGGLIVVKKITTAIKRAIARSNAKKDQLLENDISGAFAQDDDGPSDLRDIALFFLELYKMQKGLDKNAPARFAITGDSASSKMKRFELGVKGTNDWLIRRMSVGPLGEDTGSKSKCFYVIYDTHMVVKIPPAPITDMDKYVSAIRKEVQIASQLAPISSAP